jgi:hypothetical protein
MEDGIGGDAMARIRLVEDDVQSFVVGPVHQFQPLVRILVDDDRHTWHKHEDGWYRHTAVVTIAQDHERFLFRRLAIFPFMLRDKDPQLRPMLLLEGQCRLDIQTPPVSV